MSAYANSLQMNARPAPLDKQPALQRVEAADLPQSHPVAMIEQTYLEGRQSSVPQHLPSLESMMPQLVRAGLLDHCMILVPVSIDPHIDFLVQHHGKKIPGADPQSYLTGQNYTDTILPMFVNERLMELASCIVLKASRFSVAYSARPSSLNIKVYRGVFPVWMEQASKHAVILAIAPIYAGRPVAAN